MFGCSIPLPPPTATETSVLFTECMKQKRSEHMEKESGKLSVEYLHRWFSRPPGAWQENAPSSLRDLQTFLPKRRNYPTRRSCIWSAVKGLKTWLN